MAYYDENTCEYDDNQIQQIHTLFVLFETVGRGCFPRHTHRRTAMHITHPDIEKYLDTLLPERHTGPLPASCLPRHLYVPVQRKAYGAAQYLTYGQAVQHSRRAFRAQPPGDGRFWPLALLRLAHVATATPHSPRRARNQNRHGRGCGEL